MKRKYILGFFLFSTLAIADGLGINSLGVNLGYGYTPYGLSGNINAIEKPKEDTLNIELYAVFDETFDDKTIKPTLSYIYNVNQDISMHTLLGGVNKYFLFDDYSLYTGGLLGIGSIDWKYKPVKNTFDNDLSAMSYVAGVQFGYETSLDNDLLFTINTKYLRHDYDMDINLTPLYKSTFTHKNTLSISFGLRWFFNEPVDTQIFSKPKVKKVKKEKVLIDSDKDGVLDRDDKCPDSIINEIVDKKGCAKDSDNDGILDRNDKCLNSLKNEIVDAKGCAKDSDNDGVLDRNDQCLNSLKDEIVDEKGCAKDSDNDGVLDRNDKCLNSLKNEIVDANGCAKDSDNDGVVDRLDKCKNTASNFRVNSIGCERLFKINIEFPYKSAEIPSSYDKDIQKLVIYLENNSKSKAIVYAYTDSVGGEEYNKKLALKRAKSFVKNLVSKGIDRKRIRYRSMGQSFPVASNETKEGRQKNRRIEVSLQK